ncbi:unnamed protein product [Caenorhabditis brenneri]
MYAEQYTFSKSRQDQLKKASIDKLNAAPIRKDILGDWTLVSSHNTDAYLSKKGFSDFFNSTFLLTNQSFLINGRNFTQLSVVGDAVISQLHDTIGEETKGNRYRRTTRIEEDGRVLKTKESSFVSNKGGKKYDVEERYVNPQDGFLYIVNKINQLHGVSDWEDTVCVRVYKKVEEDIQDIQSTINGHWRPIASEGFVEYCASKGLSIQEQKMRGNGHFVFNYLPFFDEIHMDFVAPNCKTPAKNSYQLNKDYNGCITNFKDNSLVTIGSGIEIIRVVKEDKLFITNYYDGQSYMIVYERVL